MDIYKNALKKIAKDEKCKQLCNIIVGPTGPAGPSNGLSVYGGRYNNTSNTLSLTAGTQSQIPLIINMPNANTSYSTANSIVVNQGRNI